MQMHLEKKDFHRLVHQLLFKLFASPLSPTDSPKRDGLKVNGGLYL